MYIHTCTRTYIHKFTYIRITANLYNDLDRRYTRCLQIIFSEGHDFLTIPLLFFKSEAKWAEIVNFTSSCRAKKFILMMCSNIQAMCFTISI